jgi:hypothetical protein
MPNWSNNDQDGSRIKDDFNSDNKNSMIFEDYNDPIPNASQSESKKDEFDLLFS